MCLIFIDFRYNYHQEKHPEIETWQCNKSQKLGCLAKAYSKGEFVIYDDLNVHNHVPLPVEQVKLQTNPNLKNLPDAVFTVVVAMTKNENGNDVFDINGVRYNEGTPTATYRRFLCRHQRNRLIKCPGVILVRELGGQFMAYIHKICANH